MSNENIYEHVPHSASEYAAPTFEELPNITRLKLARRLLADQNPVESLRNEWSAQIPVDDFVRLAISIGDAYKRRGDLVQAERLYTLGLAQRTGGCQLQLLADAYIRRGDVYTRLKRWKNANIDLERGRHIYEKLSKPVAIGKAENILGIIFAARGKMKQARTFMRRALESFEKSDETLLSGIAHVNLGVVQSVFGDIDGAISHYHRARSHFEEAGDLARLGELHYRLGTAYLEKDEYAKALREFESTVTLAGQCNSKHLTIVSKIGKANTYYRMGDSRAALRLADQVLNSISIHDDQLSLAQLYLLKGRIHRDMKRRELAEWYFHTSLRINQALEQQFAIGECHYQLGVLHSQWGNAWEAKRAFGKSRASFKAIGASREVERVTNERIRVKEHIGDEIRRTRQQDG